MFIFIIKIMIKQIISIYLYFIFILISGHDINEQFLLCKQCGHEIALIKDLTFKKSDLSLKQWNDSTLFHHSTPVSIQQFRNPNGHIFDLITVSKADLFLINDTRSIKDTWFSNFYWTICICPKCHLHLGWLFDSNIVGENNFFALILDKILNEQYAETIIMQPKLRMY